MSNYKEDESDDIIEYLRNYVYEKLKDMKRSAMWRNNMLCLYNLHVCLSCVKGVD